MRPSLVALGHLIAGALVLAAIAWPSFAAPSGPQTVDLRLADATLLRVLVVRPAQAVAAIVMLPGGDGEIGLSQQGAIEHDKNFVVRTRDRWRDLGYAVLIPDAMDDRSMRGVRSSPASAAAVADLVTLAHRQTAGPVFLVGTSQGSIAAMNGAAHVGPRQIAGLVLTESVSRLGGSGETVFDASPGDVRVPTLIVANSQDTCPVSPPADAERIASAMTAAPSVKVMHVRGGVLRSKACGSLSPHGYAGIEAPVVQGIAAWMSAIGR